MPVDEVVNALEFRMHGIVLALAKRKGAGDGIRFVQL